MPAVAQVGNQPWMELKIDSHLANKVEDIDRNIESALLRGYIPLTDIIGAGKGAVAVVGSGPSLKKTWKRLRKFRGDIVACNASFQFLLERGITPKYFMCFDADPLMLEFVTPVKGVTYLLASRCPPEAFDMLEGHRIVCWHAGGDEHIEELLNKHKKFEPMVKGGTAAVTRAMILVQPIGYTELHIFGGDSSWDAEDTHIRQSTTKEQMLRVMANKREFVCSPWMAQQAEDFKLLAPVLAQNYGVRIKVHGDGLIPTLAMEMGCETDLEPILKHLSREWKWKATTLWNNL